MKRRGFLALLPVLPAGFKAAVRVVVEAQVPVGPEMWVPYQLSIEQYETCARIHRTMKWMAARAGYEAQKVFPDEALIEGE